MMSFWMCCCVMGQVVHDVLKDHRDLFYRVNQSDHSEYQELVA